MNVGFGARKYVIKMSDSDQLAFKVNCENFLKSIVDKFSPSTYQQCLVTTGTHAYSQHLIAFSYVDCAEYNPCERTDEVCTNLPRGGQ